MFLFAHIDLTLPLEDPILKFLLILVIILAAPLLLNKLKIPYLLGLIISAVMLAVVIFKIILQLLIVAALVVLCAFAVNEGAKGSPQPKIYRAKDGSEHSTAYSAGEQNRKIDAQRKD